MPKLDLLEEVSVIGQKQKPDPENRIGRNCHAFTPAENAAFNHIENRVLQLFKSAGVPPENFEIRRDAIGNLFITYFGKDRSKSVMSGSHADSVRDGGKYDGMAGVNSAFNFLEEIVMSEKTPKYNYTMVVFRAEESSPRTGIACLGSRVATGTITEEELRKLAFRNDDGSLDNLGQHIDPLNGWNDVIEQLKNPPITPGNTVAYEEMHIEQSGVIKTNRADAGIVTAGIGGAIRESVGMRIKEDQKEIRFVIDKEDPPHLKIRFIFTGEEAHTGGTPPNPRLKNRRGGTWYRKDALVAAAEFTRLFFRLAKKAGLKDKILLTDVAVPKKLGFTTVPPQQEIEIVFPESIHADLKKIAEQCMTRINLNTDVEISGEDEPFTGYVSSYDHETILKALEIPVAMEKLARREVTAQIAESGGVGRVRGTVTDFRLEPLVHPRATLGLPWNPEMALRFNLDFRDVDTSSVTKLTDEVHKKINTACKNTVSEFDRISQKRHTPVDAEAANTKLKIADSLGLRTVQMPSLPGHDAENMAKVGISTSMTFIGHDGKSHNPAENITADDYDKAERLSHAYLRKVLELED